VKDMQWNIYIITVFELLGNNWLEEKCTSVEIQASRKAKFYPFSLSNVSTEKNPIVPYIYATKPLLFLPYI
jgi:hypothetical protein